MEAGSHEVRFDASGLSSGVYIYRLTAGSFMQTRKLFIAEVSAKVRYCQSCSVKVRTAVIPYQPHSKRWSLVEMRSDKPPDNVAVMGAMQTSGLQRK